MDEKTLLSGEQVITVSDNKHVVLTNMRVRQSFTHASGNLDLTSIMLDKVSSVEVKYISTPLFLYLAGLIGVAAAVYHQSEQIFVFVAVLALAFVAAFFLTRRYVFKIASDGGSALHFQAKGMNKANLLKFVNQLEEAKDLRMRSITTPTKVTSFDKL